MTTPARDDAVERAFEAVLAGRPAPSEECGLVAFTEAVRASATAPGRPSAALADLLASGLLIDQSSPSAATARSARRIAGRGRRRRIRMLGPAMFAKFLSAGLAAKAATVAGVVVVGVGTAGFTGALPTHVQHSFATLVDFSTPFHAPDPSLAGTGTSATPADENGTADETDGTTNETDGTTNETDGTTNETDGTTNETDGTINETDGTTNETDGTTEQNGDTTDEQTPTAGDSGTAGTGAQDPSQPAGIGQQVSTMAHQNKQDGHPGVDGKTVSALAHAKHSGSSTDGNQQDGATTDATGDDNSDAGTATEDGSGDTAGTSTGSHGNSGEHAATAGHGHSHR